MFSRSPLHPRAVLALLLVIACALSALLLTAGRSARAAAAHTTTTSGWVDQPVSFQAGGVTVDATWRHPVHASGSRPAVLLIAGSGPTDRNGNSPGVPGTVDTIKTLADWLGADGVETLRYDKLGSGTTGLGRYAADPASVGLAPFELEAADGLRFLASRPGVDRARLGVFGHSEGGLFALLAATGHGGGVAVPRIHALGLLEPLSERYLTVIEIQVRAQIAAAVTARQLSNAQATAIERALTSAIAQLRRTGTVPGHLPGNLGLLLNHTTARFLSEADRYDPATLGAALPAGTPVLTSCSNDDIQVSCAEVAHLDAGLRRGRARLDAVHLVGVDHVLKVDPSRTAAHYGSPLPFSPALRRAIAAFVRTAL